MTTTRLSLTLGLMVTLGACAPNTIIRRTALINAPQAPTREGMALERGAVRLEGHLSALNTASEGNYFVFEPGFAEIGDPGVLIPDFHLGASVWAGLPAGFEVGAQFYYASMGWAGPNVSGVLPFPRREEEDLLMGGLGMRLNIAVAEPRLELAILGEVNLASIPEAVFICTDNERCSNDQQSTTLEGVELYTFDRVEHELFFLPNLALQFGWRFGDLAPGKEELLPLRRQGGAGGGERLRSEQGVPIDENGQAYRPAPQGWSLMPFLSLGLQASVTNTGFEPDFSTLPDDSLESLWMGYIGCGVDALIGKLVLGASLIFPIEGEDAIDFGVAFNFRVGVEL